MSFHTTSPARSLSAPSVRRVPPTEVTHGELAGYHTSGACASSEASGPHIDVPLSPAATTKLVPMTVPILSRSSLSDMNGPRSTLYSTSQIP